MSKYFFRLFLVAILIAGLYVAWQVRQRGGVATIKDIVNLFPVAKEQKDTLEKFLALGDYLGQGSEEKTFLVLLQNNWELRPGGGFIGSFGIVKVKSGQVSDLQIHDVTNFDGRIPDTVPPPYPLAQTLHIPSWKLRDSNFSPDFSVNAKQAEYFYKLGKGGETFDGVIGLTTNVLTSLLEITGPITLEGFPGTYAKEDAIYTLEYQVEVGYREQGITKGERKSVMEDLAHAIRKKLEPLDTFKKFQLAQIFLGHLKTKDIQLYFKNEALQAIAEEQGWAGRVDEVWQKDYLFIIDANLGAWKSDYFVKRKARYVIDLSKAVPSATLTVSYHHTAPKRDWLATHYRTYLRVYVPKGSRLEGMQNLEKPTFGTEFNKTYLGFLIDVPLTKEKTVSMTYTLPEGVRDDYRLKIQKQAGVHDVPVNITIIDQQSSKSDHDIVLHSDTTLP